MKTVRKILIVVAVILTLTSSLDVKAGGKVWWAYVYYNVSCLNGIIPIRVKLVSSLYAICPEKLNTGNVESAELQMRETAKPFCTGALKITDSGEFGWDSQEYVLNHWNNDLRSNYFAYHGVIAWYGESYGPCK